MTPSRLTPWNFALPIYSHNDPVLEINSLPYLVGNYEEMEKIYSPGSHFYRIYEERLAMQGLKLLGVFAEGFIGNNSLCGSAFLSVCPHACSLT